MDDCRDVGRGRGGVGFEQPREWRRVAVGEVIWLNYLCGSVKVTGLHQHDILQTNTI